MPTINERVALLRAQLKKNNLDAWIINGTDPHQSEYVAPRWRSREWISGFSGSAGSVLVTADEALLWVDSDEAGYPGIPRHEYLPQEKAQGGQPGRHRTGGAHHQCPRPLRECMGRLPHSGGDGGHPRCDLGRPPRRTLHPGHPGGRRPCRILGRAETGDGAYRAWPKRR